MGAAAGVALLHREELLQQDHLRASALAEALSMCGGTVVNRELFTSGNATNVVLWQPEGSASDVAESLLRQGISVRLHRGALRFMFHRMVGDVDLRHVVE